MFSRVATPASVPPAPSVIDGVFRALSDPTRRDVVQRLGSGQASVSDLAAPYDMALPSFLQHLKVLEASGLVTSIKVGRVRTYSLEADRLKLAEDWLGRQRRLWERRLDRLDAHLLTMKKQEDPE